jgi:hypothetical protein
MPFSGLPPVSSSTGSEALLICLDVYAVEVAQGGQACIGTFADPHNHTVTSIIASSTASATAVAAQNTAATTTTSAAGECHTHSDGGEFSNTCVHVLGADHDQSYTVRNPKESECTREGIRCWETKISGI